MDHIQLDARAVRVLAHPLRARLLGELRVHGASTATQLAERLATNTGATSYHLRKLAEVGLVVETGETAGKQRFWQAAQDSHGWSDADFPGDPDATAASGWLDQHYLTEFTARAARWGDERAHWPSAWRAAAHMSDALLTMTAEELAELMDELEAVVLRHRETVGEQPRPGARRVIVQLHAMPVDLEDRP